MPANATVQLPEPNEPADNRIGVYSWEDGGTAWGSYNYPDVMQNSAQDSFDGAKALRVVRGSASGDPQIYLAWIKGLKQGDKYTVRLHAKATHGAVLSGHYTSTDDPDDYSGRDMIPYQITGTDWTELEYTCCLMWGILTIMTRAPDLWLKVLLPANRAMKPGST